MLLCELILDPGLFLTWSPLSETCLPLCSIRAISIHSSPASIPHTHLASLCGPLWAQKDLPGQLTLLDPADLAPLFPPTICRSRKSSRRFWSRLPVELSHEPVLGERGPGISGASRSLSASALASGQRGTPPQLCKQHFLHKRSPQHRHGHSSTPHLLCP